MGSSQLIWPSDFPHEKPWDEFSGDLDSSLAATIYRNDRRRQILLENPCRLYGLSEREVNSLVLNRASENYTTKDTKFTKDSKKETHP